MDINNLLVSYVIPVYNVETYIERCVRSVMKQTHQKIEIILVDDGTQDSSGLIIDRLASEDDRIIVIHKKNEGVSSARNEGMFIANGDYLLFVDGDDYIEPEYTQYFLNLILQFNCDIAMNYNCFNISHRHQIDIEMNELRKSEDVIEKIYTEKIGVAVWNKMYRTSFLKDNNITFNTDYWYGEGMLFNIECLQYTDSVAIGNRRVYHQEYNPKSAMRDFRLESNLCGIRSLELQKKIWKKENKKINTAWSFHYRCFSMSILIGIIKSGNEFEYQREYHTCIRNLRKNILLPLKVDIGFKRKIIYILATISPTFVANLVIRREKRLSSLDYETTI